MAIVKNVKRDREGVMFRGMFVKSVDEMGDTRGEARLHGRTVSAWAGRPRG
ncbi:hypothetical protein GCM10017673_52400 [Streptosporangium violaceochromogenes]|nr:hypothetical protein GCM10017673_52400 [Streptosporangium violaceochromogenes]